MRRPRAGLTAPSLPAAMRLEWQSLLGRGHSRLGSDRRYAFESVGSTTIRWRADAAETQIAEKSSQIAAV
jgi:hypothetical protein